MTQPNFIQRYYPPFVVAIVMGFISTHVLFHGGPLNVIPWGLLAIMWGFIAKTKRQAWWFGAIHGFFVSYFFLWFDKTGSTSFTQFLFLLVLIILPSLFGALCGAILSRLTFWLAHLAKEKTPRV